MAVEFRNGVYRTGLTPEEVADSYTKQAECTDYDKIVEGISHGPKILADEMTSIYPTNRGTLCIMDIACGTGRLGQLLDEIGFKCIDGLDPSAGMLKVCREKNIYKNLFQEFCNDKRLPIKDDAYDCVTLTGGMGEGHVPIVALYEIVRIVKPGGLILSLWNNRFLERMDGYRERLETALNNLQDGNLLESVDSRVVANYFADAEKGFLLKLNVKA